MNSSDNFVSSSSYSNNNQMLNAINCANSQNNSFMPSVSHSNPGLTMASEPTTNSNSIDAYTSPFSPDDSSYSENSDYTSDEYDSDAVNDNCKYSLQTLTPMESSSSSSSSTNAISSSTASLPPFPTISANTSVVSVNSVGGVNANNTFLAFPQNGLNGPFAANHIAQPFSHHPQYVIHPQIYNYSELYQRHYILSNTASNSSQNCSPNNSNLLIANSNASQTSNNNICQVINVSSPEDVHQYTDLSLSIASSSAVESLNGLLSAATASSSKDNRLTPVPLTGDTIDGSSSHEMTKDNGESQESSPFVSSDSSEGDNNSIEIGEHNIKNDLVTDNCDNFGEIIKKTIVETVSA